MEVVFIAIISWMQLSPEKKTKIIGDPPFSLKRAELVIKSEENEMGTIEIPNRHGKFLNFRNS